MTNCQRGREENGFKSTAGIYANLEPGDHIYVELPIEMGHGPDLSYEIEKRV